MSPAEEPSAGLFQPPVSWSGIPPTARSIVVAFFADPAKVSLLWHRMPNENQYASNIDLTRIAKSCSDIGF
jgi:hypothetical protein